MGSQLPLTQCKALCIHSLGDMEVNYLQQA